MFSKEKDIQIQQWLNETFRNNVKEAMIHLAKMNEKNFLNHSGVFELFSIDWILGESGKLYLIEVKSSPKMLFKTTKIAKFYSQLFKDMMEIQYAYLRSRIRRIRTLLPKIHGTIAKTQEIQFSSLKRQFEKLNINSEIDREFQISSKNAFEIIYDESLDKNIGYGYVNDDCLGL